MEDKDQINKLRERIRQLEELRARQQDIHPTLPDEENLFRKVFENANDGIIIHDTSGHIYEVNQTMYARLGYTKEEMMKMSLQDLVAPGFGEKIQSRVSRLERDGVAIFESADLRKDGTVLPVEVSARLIEYNGMKLIQSIVRDIHERKTAEILIEHALQEREILQEEIMHRLRLHHDLCIAGLQSLRQHGETGMPPEALESQIRRIKALAFAQGRIYSYSNVTRINFAKIAASLVRHLLSLYAVDASRIRCDLDINDIFLDIRKAGTCAQILIELVGNTLQHAYPGGHSGAISIKMSRQDKEGYTLSVSDQGVGIPESLDIQKIPGMGMKLIGDLVAQLQGRMSLDRGKSGTRFLIRFQ
jgi:PAS domain S-box-containing protein